MHKHMEHTGRGRPELITESKLLSSQFKTTQNFILAKKPTLLISLRLVMCSCEQTSTCRQKKFLRGKPHVVRHDDKETDNQRLHTTILAEKKYSSRYIHLGIKTKTTDILITPRSHFTKRQRLRQLSQPGQKQ